MPDKSQNIVVNYKFNTADVEKAQQPLNRVNQLNNQIQQGAPQTGKAISQGFQQGTRSIISMEQELGRLKTQIQVATDPKRVAELSNQYKNLKTQIAAANKEAFQTPKALNQTGQAAQSLSSQFGALYRGVQAVFGAVLVRQVVDTAIEMARLSGNVQGVERAFNRAFPGAVGIMDSLRKATHNTITDFELMQRTLQATNLGVSVERLPELFEFAAARAQQTGESVDYLVDSIVRGIGRKSPLILDNLGLSAIRLKEKFDGAALASQSVADVTEAVADIAREEMEKMGGYVVTGATKVDQLTKSWQELKTELSEKFDSSGVVSFLNEVVDGFRNMIRSQEDVRKKTAENAALIEFNSLKEVQINKDRLKDQQQLADAIQQEINTRVELINIGQNEYKGIEEQFNKLRATHHVKHIEEMDGLKASAKAVQYKNTVYAETIKLLKGYLAELQKVNEVEEAPSGIIERKKKEIESLQDQIEKTNNMKDLGPGGRLTTALELAQAELGDLLRAFREFHIKEFKDEISDASDELSNIDEVMKRVGDSLSVTDPFSFPVAQPTSVYEPTTWDLLKEDFENNWRDITGAGIDIQAEQLKSVAEMELSNMQLRLANLREFYDEQVLLAGDNKKAKDQLRLQEERDTNRLRNEMARKEKQVRRTQVLIDIAAGIGKAFATYPWPYALIPAAFVAAQGAAQLAIINRQPTNFAKGSPIGIKGPGTETSDSIPANLSRGETVMSAWETRMAGDVLREIRARKLDNEKLRELKQGRGAVVSPVMDTQGIIKAIKDQKHPDIVAASNIVYESRKYTEDYKKRIRKASMGI